jgi:hypothetical protein
VPAGERAELLQRTGMLDAQRLRYVAGVRCGLRGDGSGQAAGQDGSHDELGWDGDRW